MKIESFILKIASHCNLNCSYCHMYNMGDLTYKNQPKFISKENLLNFSTKLRSYTGKYSIPHVFISFHGGEPLLTNKEYFVDCIETIKAINQDLEITFLMQTNGLLLDKKWAEILKKYSVNVGISLDGERKINDLFRKKHNGKGSYDDIIRNLKSIQDFDVVKGIISVANPDVDPFDFYYHMKKVNHHQLNILLPNINYSNIPAFYLPLDKFIPETSSWLISLYETWKEDTNRLSIPFFELIIQLISGYENFGNHLIGNCENGVAVIETNGDIEVIDALRTSFSGATRGNINVADHDIDELHHIELFKKYYFAHTTDLPHDCQKCEIKEVCGGGFLVHRYNKNSNDFNNPSIYCEVLTDLITYIKKDLFYETA
ncbi:radical SAM protein [Chryseobacterium indologenes]|uniref:Radical SAM protein n=1 Tax=Chryseobacterium indologenes TaxID=253 RepID=A0AAD0YVM6_CHRID|nr:radical SAM protein [Chryseobacterium indologenes]AZB19200.1 radical SAM protein [Chryseobacterium indologenes]